MAHPGGYVALASGASMQDCTLVGQEQERGVTQANTNQAAGDDVA